jgi:AraC-like DNA-binding protein
MIGKTRHDAAAGPARGILKTASTAAGAFGHARRTPAEELRSWILHYWMVEWNLPAGERQTVQTLPHPNVQLVFSSDGSALVHGVQGSKFTRVLEGNERVFGVKFRAGGFFSFLKAPVGSLLDKTIPAAGVFGAAVHRWQPKLTGPASEEEKIASANAFFLGLTPEREADAGRAAQLVDEILRDREIRTVKELSTRAGVSVRGLQRLFQQHVGVSPKWVIRRYRLHELVEQLNAGARWDGASLAVELGYFDQSHLIRDFRRLTGWSPERYRSLTSSGERENVPRDGR